MPGITVMHCDERYFIVLDRENKNIAGFTDVQAGVQYYEDLYNRNHDRGFEASASACLNFIQMQPSICEWPGTEAMAEVFVSDRAQYISSVSGGFLGAELKPAIGEAMWQAGQKPRLIVHEGEPGYRSPERLRHDW